MSTEATRLELVTAAPGDDLESPLSLEQLLRGYGPYFGHAPSDPEIFGRLEAFGTAFWRLPSSTQREFARQVWADYFAAQTLPRISQPWRVVQESINAGAPGGARAWKWLDDEEIASLPPARFLIGKHIPESGLVLLYGPTDSFKTFLSLDIALSIAGGQPWHGEAVQQGPVAYILAEGGSGLNTRVAAWKSARGRAGKVGVRFLPIAVRLLHSADLDALLADLAAWDPAPVLIVIDTLAWCFAGGDENSTADMNTFLAAIRRLQTATGATILIVHHTGHDKSRERGSSALTAAMDVVMAVRRKDKHLVVTCKKHRDGVPFKPLRFTFTTVGNSVVLDRLQTGSPNETDEKLTLTDQQVLDALRAGYDGSGLSATAWKKCSPGSESTFFRARKKLLGLSLVRRDGKHYHPSAYDDSLPTAK